jgi:hypothetical protein
VRVEKRDSYKVLPSELGGGDSGSGECDSFIVIASIYEVTIGIAKNGTKMKMVRCLCRWVTLAIVFYEVRIGIARDGINRKSYISACHLMIPVAKKEI